MEMMKKQSWKLFSSILFWCILILIALLIPPAPKEPEGLPSETWSYYGNGAPPITQVSKYRIEILMFLIAFSIVFEIVFFFYEKKKEKNKERTMKF